MTTASPTSDWPTLKLPLGSPDLRATLERGRVERDGRQLNALPTEVSDGEVVFQLVPDDALGRPAGLAPWLVAIRAISLTATATPCIAALLYGLWRGWEVDPVLAVLAVVGAVLLQVSVNVLNDVEDHLKLIDLPGRLGGSGVIQKGWLSAASMRRLGFVALAAGVLCGLPALARQPQLLLLLGGAGALGALGYSGWPFRFKYRALGDVAVFLLCGPVLTWGYALAAFGPDAVEPGVALVGSFFGLAAMAILHGNNLEDIGIDRDSGAVTLASALGYPAARFGMPLLYLAAYGVLWGGVATGRIPVYAAVAPLVGVPVVAKIVRKVMTATGSDDSALAGVRFEAAQAHLMLGVLTSIGLGIALAV